MSRETADAAATSAPEGAGAREFDYQRTVALSDGVFAIALTLLVLTLNPPDYSDDFRGEIGDVLPAIGTYALSFVVLGGFWIRHHAFFRDVRRIDMHLTVLNLCYLGFVAFVPFPTGLIGDHGDQASATVLYAFTIGMTALVAYRLRVHADRHGLLAPGSDQGPSIDALLVPLVFFVSMPIALVNADAGKLFWLALIPLGRWSRRREAGG